MHTFEPREFYTTAEVAATLRMDVRTFRRTIVKRGRIAVHQDRPGAALLVRHGDLETYLAGIRVDVRPEKERGK
jgi:hypothetical protein